MGGLAGAFGTVFRTVFGDAFPAVERVPLRADADCAEVDREEADREEADREEADREEADREEDDREEDDRAAMPLRLSCPPSLRRLQGAGAELGPRGRRRRWGDRLA